MKKNKQSIIFDFGSKETKIIIGSSKDNHIFIRDYAIVPTPPEAVFNGRIYSKTEIGDLIKDYIKDKPIKKLNMMVSISSGDLILRNFDVPNMEESELRTAVKFELENLLPEPIDNYVMDFTILEEYKDTSDDGEEVSMLKVQTAALPKYIVEAYLLTFQKAGIGIDIVDIQSNSVAKLFGGRKKLIKDFEDEETIDKNIAIIDLGYQKTSITIMEYGKVFLNRTINIGGFEITKTIGDILDMDLAEAERLKVSQDYSGIESSAIEEIQNTIDRLNQEIIMEINKIIEYFISRSIQKKLDRVYLIGGGAKAKGIVELFEKELNIVTKLGNDYRNIEVNTDETKFSEDLLYLCNSLGILLREDK